MLVVAAFLCYGGDGVGGGGLLLCLWAEIQTGVWMVHSNVIGKIKNISCQHGTNKYERRGTFSPALMVAAFL